MAYSWDIDFVPVGGGKRTRCIRFLLTLKVPVLLFDGTWIMMMTVLLMKKRDNVAVSKIGPKEGIADLDKFFGIL